MIDKSDLEYQFVTLLASSFSSVSIRWQKGKYIGGGTFGQVFAAVNLDTGGVMAVKEIRFHDSQSIKSIVPQIKEEMTVLEMLNHPNVVQYFGVEVHRDKVYIFMEFCEGGSLAGLLTHGRIEDEMVIQVYTLQMLEGTSRELSIEISSQKTFYSITTELSSLLILVPLKLSQTVAEQESLQNQFVQLQVLTIRV